MNFYSIRPAEAGFIGYCFEVKKNKIAAVILADGHNTRLQQEKSLLKLGNLHLIETQIELLSDIFSQLYVVTSKTVLKQKLPHIPTISDQYRNCGPLGGIHAALLHCEAESVFVFACDMPNLSRELIEKQITEYRKSTCDALVPLHSEGLEPLHAIYAKSCLFPIESNLKQNLCSVRSFYERIQVRYLDLNAEWIKNFYNINTHHDLRKAEIYLNCKVSNPL